MQTVQFVHAQLTYSRNWRSEQLPWPSRSKMVLFHWTSLDQSNTCSVSIIWIILTRRTAIMVLFLQTEIKYWYIHYGSSIKCHPVQSSGMWCVCSIPRPCVYESQRPRPCPGKISGHRIHLRYFLVHHLDNAHVCQGGSSGLFSRFACTLNSGPRSPRFKNPFHYMIDLMKG